MPYKKKCKFKQTQRMKILLLFILHGLMLQYRVVPFNINPFKIICVESRYNQSNIFLLSGSSFINQYDSCLRIKKKYT